MYTTHKIQRVDLNQTIIGFINSGCADEVVMSDEEFKELIGHSSEGAHAVILSVVIDPKFQGLGYSVELMNAFIEIMKSLNKQTIHLMCKDKYIKFYEKFGFIYNKISESTHGGEKWYEMYLAL